MPLSRIAAAAALWALAALVLPGPAQAQSPGALVVHAPPADRAVLYGRAVDTSGRPVHGAEIALVGTRRKTTTDLLGLFVLRDVTPDFYVISAKRLGYAARLFDVRLTPGEIVQIGLEMQQRPQQLEVVRVEERAFKPDHLAYTTKFDEFYFRREKGGGTYFDRADLQASGVRDFYDLMRRVPGMQVSESGWTRVVSMTGCPNPWVYFDGVKTGNGLHGIHDLRLGNIEAIEVYRSASTLPAIAKEGCGAIFFWFRSSPR